jgi:nicotinamide phosphoribosyltransferase
MNNLILDTDSYKFSHPMQYPPGTDYIMAYIEARGGPDKFHQSTIFFGLQMFLEKLTIQITTEMVEEAKAFVDVHIGPDICPYSPED